MALSKLSEIADSGSSFIRLGHSALVVSIEVRQCPPLGWMRKDLFVASQNPSGLTEGDESFQKLTGDPRDPLISGDELFREFGNVGTA